MPFKHAVCVAAIIASADAANLAETVNAALEKVTSSSRGPAEAGIKPFRATANGPLSEGVLCGPILSSDQLTLGRPLAGVYVDRKTLQTYNEDPQRMADDFTELVYPVLRNQRLCGAEVLVKTNENWRLLKFRDTQLSERAQDSQFYMVFTDLGATFIGQVLQGRVTIAPVTQFRGMKPTDRIPIETAFLQLLALQ